jgi:hypothetical protein
VTWRGKAKVWEVPWGRGRGVNGVGRVVVQPWKAAGSWRRVMGPDVGMVEELRVGVRDWAAER